VHLGPVMGLIYLYLFPHRCYSRKLFIERGQETVSCKEMQSAGQNYVDISLFVAACFDFNYKGNYKMRKERSFEHNQLE